MNDLQREAPREDEERARELELQNNHEAWRQNVPLLYDLMMVQTMGSASLTAQWYPDVTRPEGENYTVHRVILGTYVVNGPNHLKIADVQLPDKDVNGEFDGFGPLGGKIEIKTVINHDGEVNRARYMPYCPYMIATMSPTGDVLLFNHTNYTDTPNPDGICRPDLRLQGHEQEGYGLSWNSHLYACLLSGANDGEICLWNVDARPNENNVIDPLKTFSTHGAAVEDVQWSLKNPNLFGSADDDGELRFWDIRCQEPDKSSARVLAHAAKVNCLSFNPFSEFTCATGSSDRTVGLWDLRSLKVKLHAFESHEDDVLQVHWSPHVETILASSGCDRRLHVWDLSKIGEDQASDDDFDDGPPELIFVHGGHNARINDFAWNTKKPWVICSVSGEGFMQVWELAPHIHGF